MKQVLTSILAVVIAVTTYAQCVPNANITQQGIYPSELEDYCLSQPYADTMTIVYPLDSVFQGFVVPFDSFQVTMINNLPTGISYACNTPDCWSYPVGNTPARGCVNLIGSPSALSTTDSIELNITAWATFFGNPIELSGITQKVKLTSGGSATTAWSYDPPSGLSINFYNNTSGATTTNWDFGDGTTSTDADPSHTYTQGGTYTVCLSTVSTCGSDVACLPITVSSGPVGINDLLLYNTRLYPNPVKDVLNMELPSLMERVECKLSNTLGQTCKHKVFSNTDRITLNMEVEPGLYLLELSDSSGKRAAFRVVKE